MSISSTASVRILGLSDAAAQLHEFFEFVLKFGVVDVGGFDLVFELGGDFADLVAVGLHGLVKVLVSDRHACS